MVGRPDPFARSSSARARGAYVCIHRLSLVDSRARLPALLELAFAIGSDLRPEADAQIVFTQPPSPYLRIRSAILGPWAASPQPACGARWEQSRLFPAARHRELHVRGMRDALPAYHNSPRTAR
ncbi:hypothetical protein P280DRAFT_128057 [Massarina eburnea CBS 473.64]|uniref:Uncharacterized protein n=1 Tax=Massarina eburnea CBS 473.64 TaxID=1395130 RepID=A0A6A6SF47_9PLEO|nr:hypothetical protein P280DRAFT_128057 [Massarina eburnea CBS 473.64]